MENFEQVAKKYEPMIHRIMANLNIFNNQEEYFQLGLITLWRVWKNYDAKKAKFITYAYGSVKGVMLYELSRKTLREERNVFPMEEFWTGIEDSSTYRSLEMEQLLSYCEELTENQTKWVIETFLHDKSIKQIAEQEQVSISAVKAWKKGALRKIKLQIESEEVER